MRAQDLNVEQPEIGERLGAGPPRATRDEPLVRRPRRGLGARAHRRGPAPTLASAVLVGVMAVRSPINAHPDEVLHLVAGQYFREHWLPPPVGGTSYLDEADIVHWAFGKAAALGNGLRLAPSTAMRPRSRRRWLGLPVAQKRSAALETGGASGADRRCDRTAVGDVPRS
jgi:hypothetical protein